jgi:hypothetical protein
MLTRPWLPALACAALLFSLAGHGNEKAAKPEPPDPAEAAVGLRLNAREVALLMDGYNALLREATGGRAALRQLKPGHPRVAQLKQELKELGDDMAETKKRLVGLEKERRKLARAAGSAGEAADPADRTARALEKIVEKLDSIDKRLEKAERRK